MLHSKRFLITGGAGFIGSELVGQLAGSKVETVVVDNLANGKRANISDFLNGSVSLEIADIRDDNEMRRLLKDIDVVFHLACLGVRHSIHSPLENHEVNASATLSLLKLSREAGVKRFVYVSSSEVYGTGKYIPMTEDHPTFPHTVYGASKLAGDCYTRAFGKTYNYPVVVVRPFNCYGPRSHHEGDCGEVIPKFILRAMAGKSMVVFGDGNQTRDFTYVSDTARGILLAGLADNLVGHTLNIGFGGEISINELAKTIAKILDLEKSSIEHNTPRPGDVLRLFADTAKAEEYIGFKPKYTLEEGLRALIEWYREKNIDPNEALTDEIVQNWIVE